MGLLGYALGEHAGKSYEELVVERICRRLDMKDTTTTLSKDQKRQLASGISAFGLPAMNWDLPTLSGAGGIRSTLDDMLKFLRANLAPDKSPLAKAIRLSHLPRFTVHEPSEKEPFKVEIGLGWHITTDDGLSIIWHNGMTGGYASYVGFVPDK